MRTRRVRASSSAAEKGPRLYPGAKMPTHRSRHWISLRVGTSKDEDCHARSPFTCTANVRRTSSSLVHRPRLAGIPFAVPCIFLFRNTHCTWCRVPTHKATVGQLCSPWASMACRSARSSATFQRPVAEAGVILARYRSMHCSAVRAVPRALATSSHCPVSGRLVTAMRSAWSSAALHGPLLTCGDSSSAHLRRHSSTVRRVTNSCTRTSQSTSSGALSSTAGGKASTAPRNSSSCVFVRTSVDGKLDASSGGSTGGSGGGVAA
mmetsp:Transcript_25742/g.82856  ORF Transcript_25742/g.82856 Transcript_25742/m.82856 type:complete len:264 (+) Transcript_25742:761-1552(+)